MLATPDQPVDVRITNSHVDNNQFEGIYADARKSNVRMIVSNTSIGSNLTGVRLNTTVQTTGKADVTLDHCIISYNSVGVLLFNQDIRTQAVVRLYGNVISYNTNAGAEVHASTAYTYGNNAISANNPDVSGALTALPQQV